MTLPKNPKMFRCILVNQHGARVTYIGPFGEWSKEWHMLMRRVANPRGGMAA